MTLATSCVTTAPCFVSPYAGIHPQRPFHPPRRKETVGQIRRETACSPNRSKIKRENETKKEEEDKKRRKDGIFIHRISRYSLVANTTGEGTEEKAIEIEENREDRRRSKKKTYGRARAPRDRKQKERERVSLRSLEMVNGDNEARDKRRRIIG